MMKLNDVGVIQRKSAPIPINTIVLYGILTLIALFVLFPLFMSLSVALQGATIAPRIVPDFAKLDFGIFREVFVTEPSLVQWIVNSFLVASVVTIGVLITSSLAAFALSMPGFAGKRVFLFICLGTLMIPFEATIIPNYLFVSSLGWRDTYPGLIVPFLASGFGIFLLRQYFMTIPRDLDEAAKLDGASSVRIFWSIILPLSGPAIATVAIFSFLQHWNEFIGPLIFLNTEDKYTLSIGLRYFLSNPFESDEPREAILMAASLIVAAPSLILFFVAQKYFVRGIVTTGLKG